MFGKTPSQAQDGAAGTDQKNVELVARTREQADLVVRLINIELQP